MKIHKISKNWDFSLNDYWIGGRFPVPNQSKGYHGILKQWWEHYKLSPSSWLLVSETNNIKEYFSKLYPNDTFLR